MRGAPPAPRPPAGRRRAGGARDLSNLRSSRLNGPQGDRGWRSQYLAASRRRAKPIELRLAAARDELLGAAVGLVVRELHGRVLHEAGRGRFEDAAAPAIEGELRAAHGV